MTAWKWYSAGLNAPQQQHTHIHTHNVSILKFDKSDIFFFFYLRLLLLILERIFPLRSQPVAVVVEVVNDGHLHVLRLHLSRFIRLASPSQRVTHTGCYSTAPGGAPAPEDDVKLCPSSPRWRCSCRRFAPLVCWIRCPCAPRKGGVKAYCRRKVDSLQAVKGHRRAAWQSKNFTHSNL